jgi:hypothetical protein
LSTLVIYLCVFDENARMSSVTKLLNPSGCSNAKQLAAPAAAQAAQAGRLFCLFEDHARLAQPVVLAIEFTGHLVICVVTAPSRPTSLIGLLQ